MFILQVFGFIFLGSFALVLLYICLVPLGILIPVNLKFRPIANGIPIFLTTNGMHTDFVLPTKNNLFDWTKIIDNQPYAKAIKDYPYLGLGWGDWNFYIELDAWENLGPKLAANALLNPTTKTLMHITGYEILPHETLKLSLIHISEPTRPY